MPCYLGQSNSGANYYSSSGYQANGQYSAGGGPQAPGRPQVPVNSALLAAQQVPSSSYYQTPSEQGAGRQDTTRLGSNAGTGAAGAAIYPPPPVAFGPVPGRAPSDGLTSGGQSVPRANTIDNFIALVSKIESANPMLAQNVDELIKLLLSRFRMDNYYYDARSRIPISTDSSDRRNSDILPALLAPSSQMQQSTGQAYDAFAGGQSMSPSSAHYSAIDRALDHDERCSMYFMLSHFIDKTSATPSLSQMPLPQLQGPLQGQRAPNLQVQSMSSQTGAAAGGQFGNRATNLATSSGGAQSSAPNSNYPAQSAQLAYSAGSSGPRYSGPSPSFGSPAASQMSQFGSGISNSPTDYSGQNAYGVNSPLATGPIAPSAYNNPLALNARGVGSFGQQNLASNRLALGAPPYIDGQARARGADDKVAFEYGVVTLPNQKDAAIVLNRVLMGILASTTPAQTIRQLAAQVYSNHNSLNLNTPKVDEELDALFGVTLADLWAVSSIPKAGRPFDLRLLGDNGHWNDTFCPTTFTLERAGSIKFTTAELLGGLDGFNLGMLRRRLMSMRRKIRLSEMLRIYYSPTGFRPQFAEIGVCNRYAVLSTQLDDLHRQAEIYARLLQLNLPTNDNEIAMSINRLDAFREMLRQAAGQFAPQSICQESAGMSSELYPMNSLDSCEVSRADVVAVLDSSVQANGDPFMQLVVTRLAQRLGLAARAGSSLSVMTNQLDTTGTAGGGYSFNTILRNSTNLAEIGCALMHDSTRIYQGGQITDPTRLIELFERALVSLDSEYLTRQIMSNSLGSGAYSSASSSSSSSSRPQTFVSTWFGGSGLEMGNNYMMANMGGPQNTGGAKVVLWFNFANQGLRPNSAASGPTSWIPGQTYMSSSSSRQEENEFRFYEAKRLLKENFRGASVLAISPSRDSVKMFVYDEERDIFTDVPAQSSMVSVDGSSPNDYQPASGLMDMSMNSGQADQLIGKIIQRMCTIPALFQYPMCFRGPSEGAQSVGYISPGRKQYWMMAPKTFFASRSIRMSFRVEGGRLRVCFGRRPNPDETAMKNRDQQNQIFQPQPQQQQQQQQQAISLGDNGRPSGISTQSPPKVSSDDYYTGMEYGVCKDVSPGNEIDFLIADACYKKSISECEPFYFVIQEVSQPGEGDPMYMCRDDGCKRFDQVKFVMTHSGVVCSSARRTSVNWFVLMMSTMLPVYLLLGHSKVGHHYQLSSTNRVKHLAGLSRNYACLLATMAISFMFAYVQQVDAQLQAGVYDFGQGRYGEKRGNFTPSEWVAIVLIIMLILGGLAITVALCYYVAKKSRPGMTPVPQNEF